MEIRLTGTFNSRDLGGMKTEDGKTIKVHRLIRSDNLSETTEEDKRILTEEYDLRQILDLRTLNELSEQAPARIDKVSWIHLPVLQSGQAATFEEHHEDHPVAERHENQHENSEAEAPSSNTDSSMDPDDPENVSMAHIFRESIAQMNYDVPSAMKNMYSNVLSDDYSTTAICKFFELLLACEEGSTLWHCTAGKDRTGILSFLLLGTLGVGHDDILTDYLISEKNLRPQTDAIISEIRKETEDAVLIEQVRILNSVLPEYIDIMFDCVRKLGGDIPGYMMECLKFSDSDISDLKKLYLD